MHALDVGGTGLIPGPSWSCGIIARDKWALSTEQWVAPDKYGPETKNRWINRRAKIIFNCS